MKGLNSFINESVEKETRLQKYQRQEQELWDELDVVMTKVEKYEKAVSDLEKKGEKIADTILKKNSELSTRAAWDIVDADPIRTGIYSKIDEIEKEARQFKIQADKINAKIKTLQNKIGDIKSKPQKFKPTYKRIYK